MDSPKKWMETDTVSGPRIQMNLELGPMSLTQAMQVFEKHYITLVMQENQGHKSKTAAMLHIDRKTLYRKMRCYDMLGKF